MPTIRFKDKDYDCPNSENLLDSLNRQGANLPFSCCAGHCWTCMSKATQGQPPAASQAGLKDTQKAQGYFLPCVCKPEMDLHIEAMRITSSKWQSTVIQKSQLSDTVVRLRLQKPAAFTYHAGQYVAFFQQGKQRCYSLASINSEPLLEFHIRRVPEGKVSTWLCDEVQEGDQLHFSDVRGDCFYIPNSQPLLLLATGTGLAPLYGIMRQAITQQHPAPIHIFHSCNDVESLYYRQELAAISAQYAHVTYDSCVVAATQQGDVLQGDMVQLLQQSQYDWAADDWAGWRVYLSGKPDILDQLRLLCLQKGVRNMDIYADAFT
ncbi:MAG: 2Fe-2S iron-sulfur cluster-binding protein [Mariprofundaceae bacterium]|nr:2Fe-2S iron-sulfur cluster-binding protein [Mariprofundaceae bacterium]